MVRIRTIKPEFWQDEKLAPMTPIERLTFLGLVSMADDAGRLLDNVKIIDAFIFPETDDTCRDALATLSRMRRVYRGRTSSGQSVIQIANWSKHQRVDKPNNKTCLPPIVEKSEETQGTSVIRDAFANDSRHSRDALALRPTTDDRRPTTDDLYLSDSIGREIVEDDTGSPKSSVTYSADFLKFWQSFPRMRRTGKREAFRKWKVAVKTAEPGYLISRAVEYAKSEKGRSEFAVMPSTWLNKGMWEDDADAWGPSEIDRTPTLDDLKNWTPGGST